MELIVRKDSIELHAESRLDCDLIDDWRLGCAIIKTDVKPNPPLGQENGNFKRKAIRIVFK